MERFDSLQPAARLARVGAAACAVSTLATAAVAPAAKPPRPPCVRAAGPRAGPSRPRAVGPAAPLRNLILITVDGVRPRELFAGVDPRLAREQRLPGDRVVGAAALLPHLHRRFFRGGIAFGGRGEPVLASGPSYTSLAGYREIFTGRTQAGCLSNDCGRPERPTFLEHALRALHLDPTEVAVVTSWPKVDLAVGHREGTFLVSAGRRGGATREGFRKSAALSALLDAGARARPQPGRGGYRPDRHTAALALAYLAAQRPRLLVIGLGDPDEHGHHDDYGAYLTALQLVDQVVGKLFQLLDGAGAYGRETMVLVTTDHGRAADFESHGLLWPESGRTWLLAAGAGVAPRGSVSPSRTLYLSDIAPTLRAWWGLGADSSPRAGRPIAELLPPRRRGTLAAGPARARRLRLATR